MAPDFESYIAGHVALRCLDVALGVALGVLAVESVPAGNRGLTLALLLLANGLGLAMAVAVLPLAAAGRSGLAAAYGLQLLALPLMVHAGRRLAESARFVAHVHERHRYRELLSAPYLRRVALVGSPPCWPPPSSFPAPSSTTATWRTCTACRPWSW